VVVLHWLGKDNDGGPGCLPSDTPPHICYKVVISLGLGIALHDKCCLIALSSSEEGRAQGAHPPLRNNGIGWSVLRIFWIAKKDKHDMGHITLSLSGHIAALHMLPLPNNSLNMLMAVLGLHADWRERVEMMIALVAHGQKRGWVAVKVTKQCAGGGKWSSLLASWVSSKQTPEYTSKLPTLCCRGI
jgi:hypothetical protein